MSSSFARGVVAVAALVLVIGGITWVVQFMPQGQVITPVAPAPPTQPSDTREVLRFSRMDPRFPFRGVRAVWNREDRLDPRTNTMTPVDGDYVLEYEPNKDGFVYFPFRNMLDTAAEMGIAQPHCDCSHAEVCLLPTAEWEAIDALLNSTPWAKPALSPELTWRKFSKDDREFFQVPADGHGLLRVHWNGRKAFGEMLKIHLVFASNPVGEPRSRQFDNILVPVVMAPPLRFEPIKQSVGYLNPGETRSAEIFCWSPTRDSPLVSFQLREPDPLFEVESRPLTADECKGLEDRLYEDENKRKKEDDPKGPRRLRVKSGFLVKATFHEHKGTRQMDLGHVARAVPVFLDELPLEYPGPVITTVVKGDVEVGGLDDRGRVLDKVQLGTFSAEEGTSMVIQVLADPKVGLETAEHQPAILKVQLKRNLKASTSQRARWDLRVTVPAQGWIGGPLPEHSAVILRVAGTPRVVRIPVTGTATR